NNSFVPLFQDTENSYLVQSDHQTVTVPSELNGLVGRIDCFNGPLQFRHGLSQKKVAIHLGKYLRMPEALLTRFSQLRGFSGQTQDCDQGYERIRACFFCFSW